MPTAEPSTPEPDVRQVGQLEQALDRAVLAVRAVQQREHDVDAEPAAARPARTTLAEVARARRALDVERGGQRGGSRAISSRAASAEQPLAVGRDRDRHDLVPLRVERPGDRDRGHARHVVLGGAAAEESITRAAVALGSCRHLQDRRGCRGP